MTQRERNPPPKLTILILKLRQMENTINKAFNFKRTTCHRTEKEVFSTSKFAKHQSKLQIIDFDITEVAESPVFRENQNKEQNRAFNFGAFNAEDCIKRITEGNAEFIPPTGAATPTQEARQTVRRRKKRNEFDGNICIDSYLSGNSNVYIEKVKRTAEESAPVDIYLNLGANCKVKADELQKFYNDIIKETYLLVLAGKMVNLYAFTVGLKVYKNGNHLIARTQLKESGQPTDYKKIAVLIYPAFYRHVFFKAFHASRYKPVNQYGYPMHEEEIIKEALNTAFPETANRELKMYDFKSWQSNGRKL